MSQYHTDNGAPCPYCQGTVYSYTLGAHALVYAYCYACKRTHHYRKTIAYVTAADASRNHRDTVR